MLFYPVMPFKLFGTQALSLMMAILPRVGRSIKFQLENVFFLLLLTTNTFGERHHHLLIAMNCCLPAQCL